MCGQLWDNRSEEEMEAEREKERPTCAGLEVVEEKREDSLGTMSLPSLRDLSS